MELPWHSLFVELFRVQMFVVQLPFCPIDLPLSSCCHLAKAYSVSLNSEHSPSLWGHWLGVTFHVPHQPCMCNQWNRCRNVLHLPISSSYLLHSFALQIYQSFQSISQMRSEGCSEPAVSWCLPSRDHRRKDASWSHLHRCDQAGSQNHSLTFSKGLLLRAKGWHHRGWQKFFSN